MRCGACAGRLVGGDVLHATAAAAAAVWLQRISQPCSGAHPRPRLPPHPPSCCPQLAKLLVSTSTPSIYLKGRVVSGGIINLQQLVREAIRKCRRGPTCAV